MFVLQFSFTLVLHGAGLETTNVDQQIDNGALLFFASRSEPAASDRSTLLGFRLLRPLGAAQ